MDNKTITTSEFIKENLQPNIAYTIVKTPHKSIKQIVNGWLESKGLDSYSRYVKSQYRKGITDDLTYNDTIGKCITRNEHRQYIRFIWIDGYSDFMKLKEDDIDKNIEYKIKKLISDGKVGYLDGDSFGCYLSCRKDDYTGMCKYLGVEYDTRDDEVNFYYNSLFDDILGWFKDYCCNEDINDKTIYDVARYTIVHIDKYVDIFINAREYGCTKDNTDEYWVNKLWNKAYNDMRKINVK